MHVIGTAGHVDHGKSTLVRAMSGIDPDRLREEKERGMTIDLGFAWVTLPTGESVGIVDVPGHADFIKNMLAGVGSVDAALLVVAADEGVMPQTREHLDILDLLEVSTGVVAITKADMAESEDWLELVQADVAETIAGTALENAPIIPVSAVTGQGVDELLATLGEILRKTPPRADKGRPRLFIDRVFTISGFGTVVTGTLIDGIFSVGQEVEIQPTGLKARIRGLQSHKKAVDTVGPGNRVAINLSGINKTDLSRGDVVTTPGWLESAQLIDTRLRCLPESPHPLKHNQLVDVFIGAMEVSAHVRLLNDREILPGESGWVQLRLARRIPTVRGDHFIIRQPSPSITIGGGVVVDPMPLRRHRRFRPQIIQRLETLAHGTPEDLLLGEIDRLGVAQVRVLANRSALSAESFASTLHTLFTRGNVFAVPRDDTSPVIANPGASKVVVSSAAGWGNIVAQIQRFLSAYHTANPLRRGMSRGELMSRLKLETGIFNKVIDFARQENIIGANESAVWLTEHSPQFSPHQQQMMEALLKKFNANPMATPSYKESLKALGGDEALLNAMLESGNLLRLSADVLILPQTFTDFVVWLRDFVAKNGSVTVAQVRDAFNTSRKYALALLEYCDSQGITRREGDERILRKT